MIATDQAALLMDQGEVVGTDGDTIGKVGQVYVDNENGQLTWVTVKTGWFGSNESFVPLDNATLDGHTVTVPYDKAKVKDAPHHDADASLSVEDENDLYYYYGVQHGMQSAVGTAPGALDTTGHAGTDTKLSSTAGVDPIGSAAGPGAVNTDGYLTRSEEQLKVGTQRVETGRARLKKFIVTEQQTVTVPVSHEEVHIVRETLDPGAVTDAVIGEDAVEVTLMADKVVVAKEAVAVERVKLGTEIITEQEQVTQAVRKEQIEMTTDGIDSVADQKTGQQADGLKGKVAETADTMGAKAEGLVHKVKNAVKS